MGQNPEKLTGNEHGQLRSRNKNFIVTQMEIKIETSFARMHYYQLPISIPLVRTKTRLWFYEREKQKKCYLPHGSFHVEYEQSILLFKLKLIQFGFCLPEDYTS